MVLDHKTLLGRRLLALAVPLGCVLLAGCGGDGELPKEKNSVATSAPEKAGAIDSTAADRVVMQQLAQENAPRVVTFQDPGIGEPSAYLDAKQPMTTFNLYNAKRDWNEVPEDIADSIGDAFNVRTVSPELYRLAAERLSEQDTFKKRDLTTALGVLVGQEAEQNKQRNLVKLSSDDWAPISLSSYDPQAKGFRIDNCLFSDKLDYTDEEKRNQTSLARASKLRCYINPGPTSYYLGFQGGSDVLLDVPSESLAREIESSKGNLKIDIYGYVKSVGRERFAGEFGPQRFVLIGPQRIDIKSPDGKIIYSKNI
ncbi:hypothetical protein [Pseudomonas sp. K2I15]|uniref:hypothetical protein n=1 Tax=Pseudomonas sp. K2I15 TaxID=2013577 RepID=UPI000B4DBA0E|nr:hypothetical protein [Pseudomonas sp. K2I15]OWP72945.1 hypothetical protein CEC48_04510 [Pseudomonas sp. K2I15]